VNTLEEGDWNILIAMFSVKRACQELESASGTTDDVSCDGCDEQKCRNLRRVGYRKDEMEVGAV